MHNVSYDKNWLDFFGYEVLWPIYDTMIVNSVYDDIDNGLKPLALFHTDMGQYDQELEEELDANGDLYDKVDPYKLAKYSAWSICFDFFGGFQTSFMLLSNSSGSSFITSLS